MRRERKSDRQHDFSITVDLKEGIIPKKFLNIFLIGIFLINSDVAVVQIKKIQKSETQKFTIFILKICILF